MIAAQALPVSTHDPSADHNDGTITEFDDLWCCGRTCTSIHTMGRTTEFYMGTRDCTWVRERPYMGSLGLDMGM